MEMPEEFQAEQVMIEETERHGNEEKAVTAEEEVKSAAADANGFVTSIDRSAFHSCHNLTVINVSGENNNSKAHGAARCKPGVFFNEKLKLCIPYVKIIYCEKL